jgi:predicted Ser/Thr protein kinase
MPSDQEVQTEIAGRYRLLSEIGSGGMGTVWHAEDTLLKRAVAVKEIALPRAVASEERDAIRKRVLREARAAAALNHANAVTVYDVIEEDGKAFIVMECISGRTLNDVVKKDGPLSDERASRIVEDVLSALEVAHRAGIVHRDVKPANVMITDDGRTKLADFGIASVKDDPKITASGLILGSPSYMAPEQATHGSSGPEADLWGLGATLYFALEGVPPFQGDGPIPTLTAVVGDEARPMENTSGLTPVVDALLEKEPGKRATSKEVRAMLNTVTTASGPIAAAPATTTRVEEPPIAPVATAPATQAAPEPAVTRENERRGPWMWLVGLGALILLALVVATFINSRDDSPEPREGRSGERAAGSAEGSEASEDVAVPANWTTYEDPTLGYELSYPSEWTVEGEGSSNTFFTDPASGTYLQVAWRQPPSELGPEGAWEAQAETFAADHENYQEIRIDPTTFQDMDAAEWEFTYEDGGAQLHALDLGFITSDEETGMALFFQTHEEDWESSQELFEQLKAGFRPPA